MQKGEAAGFLSGLKHPVSGLDHVLAMVAVGLWGAQLGAPAVWLLPVAFPMVMAFGGMLGLMGVPLPGIEYGIAASAILLGIAVMFELRPPLAIAAIVVGIFAIFHGHAHGTELPPGQSGLLYSMGFVIATGCLHGVGISYRHGASLGMGTEIPPPGRSGRGHGRNVLYVEGVLGMKLTQTPIARSAVRCGLICLRDVSAGGRSAFEFHRHGPNL